MSEDIHPDPTGGSREQSPDGKRCDILSEGEEGLHASSYRSYPEDEKANGAIEPPTDSELVIPSP